MWLKLSNNMVILVHSSHNNSSESFKSLKNIAAFTFVFSSKGMLREPSLQ